MKKFAMLLGLAVVCVGFSTCRDKNSEKPEPPIDMTQYDNYYMYYEEKIELEKLNNKSYILFENKDIQVVSQQLTDIGIEMEAWPLNISNSAENPNGYLKNCTQAVVYVGIEEINEIKKLIYIAPFYTDLSREEIGITAELSVVLKRESDLPKLKQLCENNRVLFLGKDTIRTEYYILACTQASMGNALQMANLFYETGLFETAIPGFITTIHPIN